MQVSSLRNNVRMTDDLTLPSSMSQSWKLIETDRMISNQLLGSRSYSWNSLSWIP